jgi:hypothetical protein
MNLSKYVIFSPFKYKIVGIICNFFLENTGELHFIILRRKSGQDCYNRYNRKLVTFSPVTNKG